jgi:hypothetical protein
MFAIWTRRHADPLSRQRRTTAIGFGLSALLHALLLVLTFQYRLDPSTPLASGQPGPITVRLAPRAQPESIPEPSPPPQAKPRPERPRSKVIAVPKSASRPKFTVPKEPEPKPVPPQAQETPIDMTAMINAARARRQQAEASAAQENAAAATAERGPSPNDVAMANIQRSLQGNRDGTGGVFQVVHKGVRTGTFIFRGWTPGRNATQQTIEVDAGPNGDVERAIVRRMIELIRTHYSGDFNWESHRLGRVLVKSARVEDSKELEDFMMREFFGS